MLLKDYYTINDTYILGETTIFQISLLSGSEIYQGHFPGKPISPGVCNIQMIKECAERVAGKSLLINNLQQCKLTGLVTPLIYSHIEVIIHLEEQEGSYKLKATLGNSGETYLELKAELIEDAYKVNGA